MAFTSFITAVVALLAGAAGGQAGAATTAVHQAHCFSSPSSCGFPAPSNTGVPKGTTLKPSGDVTVSDDGAVVSGLEVTGTITVDANDVTIENTRVVQNTTCGDATTCGNFAIVIEKGASAKISHVETASTPGSTCEHDIRNEGGTVTIESAYLHACDSNVYAEGPTTLKNSYGIAKIAIADDHVENIYFNETKFVMIHSTLLNPVEQTAVVFGNSGGGTDVENCSNRLTIIGSLLAGGGYTLYPCAHASSPGSSYTKIEGNHFARCVSRETYIADGGTHPCADGPDSSGYFPNSGSFGIATNSFAGAGVWRDNVWDNNLAKICSDGRTVKGSCGQGR
jgi:hypothetical protein